MAWAKAPFCTGGRTVRLDMGGIDRNCSPHATVTGQGLEDTQPDTLAAPTIEPVVDGCVRSILRWAVTPTCATLKHVHDAGNDAPIINPVCPLAAAR